MNEKRIEILYDHYKDTFDKIRQYSKERERYFAASLFVLALLLFESNNYSLLSTLTLNVLDNSIGGAKQINFEYLDSMLMFIFLSIIVKYIQINLWIERLYPYLHEIEEALSEQVKIVDIRREGKLYLGDYPKVKWLIHRIYQIVYPCTLILVTAIKFWSIIQNHKNDSWGFTIFDIILCILIFILGILYFHWIYKNLKKNNET